MLISPAYAQAAAPAAGGDMLMSLAPLLLIFVVFYFLLIRPQQTKLKQHRAMIENLKKGDQIVTAGGMVGKVMRVDGTDGDDHGGDRSQSSGQDRAPHRGRPADQARAGTGVGQRQPGRGRIGRRLLRQAARQEVSPAADVPHALVASLVVAAVCLFGIGALLPNFFSRATLDSLPGWVPCAADHARARPAGRLLLAAGGGCSARFSTSGWKRWSSDLAGVAARRRGSAIAGLGVQGDTVNVTLSTPASVTRRRPRSQKLNPLPRCYRPDPRLRRRRRITGGSCSGCPRPSATS